MQPLISVIVPVHNGQDYLEKCIESIENQTYDNLEVFIINDGSTDNTGQICAGLMERYANVRVITMEDEGVSAARNAGLDAAKGAFVTFVDADDRLRPKMLEALFEGMMETAADICGCQFFQWQKEEQWEGFLSQKYHKQPARSYRATPYLKEEILAGNSRCWSKLYRRSVIGKLRFQRGLSIGEDMLFLIQLLPYVRAVAEIPYPGYGYYQNPRGAMNRPFTPAYMDQITCWELAREEAVKLDETLEVQVTSILIMGIILVAGKLAFLPSGERRRQRQYIRICHDKLQEELKIPGVYERLSTDYQTKAKFFVHAPGLYLWLYHFRKYMK